MLAFHSEPSAAQPLFLTPRAELRRLDAHFRRVLSRLHRSPPAGLGWAQRRARARHLEELERYRRRGRFPKNRSFPGLLVPHFIDDEGTRCAMGQLIEQAGGADLVHFIARTRNYDRIHDLADIPELLLWLEENGLTADEAARIQPSYCETAANCICYGISPAVIEGDYVATDTILVTAVYGDGGGIMAGDTLNMGVSNYAPAVVGDHVLARQDTFSTPPGWVLDWVVNASDEVTVSQCSNVALPPGPLPKQTLIDAVLAANDVACAAVLEAYDPEWTTPKGDCGTTTGSSTTATTGAGGGGGGGGGGEDDGGCAMGTGAEQGGTLALALLAGVFILRGGRRVIRR